MRLLQRLGAGRAKEGENLAKKKEERLRIPAAIFFCEARHWKEASLGGRDCIQCMKNYEIEKEREKDVSLSNSKYEVGPGAG